MGNTVSHPETLLLVFCRHGGMLELDWVNVTQSKYIENSLWETLITTQEQHFPVTASMVEKGRLGPNSLFQYREQL